jgi:hypothetical protein
MVDKELEGIVKILRTILFSILIASLALAWGLPTAQVSAAVQPEAQFSQTLAPLAATVRLVFNNKTGVKIDKLVLTGLTIDKNYTFYNVAPGKTEFSVEKGKYSLEYPACGKTKVKKVNVSGTLKLNTATCPTAVINVNNLTGGTLYLNLSGPTTFRFTLPAGKTKITVWKGLFDYTGSGRCGSMSGEIKVKNRTNWSWWCY